MASTIQIDRLLETTVRRGASDLHLAVGKPPSLRLHGRIRELQTKPLEAEDTMALMKAITPERIQQEFEETGSGDFGFAYGEEARFRVAIFKQKGAASLVLRRIPNKILTFEQIGLPEMARQICSAILGRPICSKVRILLGIFRSTSEQCPFCLKIATRKRASSP